MSEPRPDPSHHQRIPAGVVDAVTAADVRADSDAAKEAAAYAAGTLEEVSKRLEHGRTERFREHIARVALCAVWLVFAVFIIAALILAWHYLMPRGWGWLDADQLNTIRTFVFGGTLSSAATSYFIRRI